MSPGVNFDRAGPHLRDKVIAQGLRIGERGSVLVFDLRQAAAARQYERISRTRQFAQDFGGDAAGPAGGEHDEILEAGVARRIDAHGFGYRHEDRPISPRVSDFLATAVQFDLRKHIVGELQRTTPWVEIDGLDPQVGALLEERFEQSGSAAL